MNSLKTSIWHWNIINKASALLMIFLLFSFLLKAQPAGLTLANIGGCENNTVLIPLTGSNLTNIGAITLFISYDTLSLKFLSVENVNPQLNGLLANTMSNPPMISIVWSRTAGATFQNSTLLFLKFTVLQKSSSLSFIKEICEIANNAIPPQVLTVNFSDGGVYPADPVIISEPENRTVLSQSNVNFQVSSPNASSYAWQESRTNGTLWSNLQESFPYSGSQTNTLTIQHVSVNFDQFRYRCILNPNNCDLISAAAILSVDSTTGFSENLSEETRYLTSSPNPFTDKTTLEYVVPENGWVTIKIFSITGQVMGVPVESKHTAGFYKMQDNFVYLPVGIYCIRYVFKGTSKIYEINQKVIKINRN